MAQTALKKQKAESAAKKWAANKDTSLPPENNVTSSIETSAAATGPTDEETENTMTHPRVSRQSTKKSPSENPPSALRQMRTRSASASGVAIASLATSLGSTTKSRSRSVSVTPSDIDIVPGTRPPRKTSAAIKTLIEAIRIDEVSEGSRESETDEDDLEFVVNEYENEYESEGGAVSWPQDKLHSAPFVAGKPALKRFQSTKQAPKLVKRAKIYESNDGDSEDEGAEDNGECNQFIF